MPTALANAYVQVVPTTKGLQGALTKQFNGGEAESAGTSVGNSFIGKLKGIIIAAGIGKTISAALSEGSSLQQSLGGVETLFKESANEVIANANAAYKTAGLSANAYMETVTGFSASLLKSMGGDTSKAAGVADMALRDMSDNANKFGTDMSSIQYAYQGFAKQNYTMLDNLKLGYGGTQKEMKRLLKDATKLTGVKYDINNLSDVYNAIHVIQEDLGVTGTTAAESASTFSGSMASMKAAASNLLAGIALGQDVGPQIDALTETVGTFFTNNFMPMLTNVLTGAGKAAPKLVKSIVSGITQNLPDLAVAAVEIVSALSSGFAASLPIVLDALPGLLSTIAQTLLANIQPLMDAVVAIAMAIPGWLTEPGNLVLLIDAAADLLLALIQGIVTALPLLAEAAWEIVLGLFTALTDEENLNSMLQAGSDILKAAWDGIKQVFNTIVTEIGPSVMTNIVDPIKEKAGELLTAGSELLSSLQDGIVTGFSEILTSIGEWVKTNIIQPVKDKISDMKTVGKDLVEGLWQGITDSVSWLTEKIGGWAKGILESIKRAFGVHSPSKKTEWMGQMLSQGLAAGILDDKGSVAAAWDQVSAILSPVQSGVSVSAAGDASGSRYGGIVIHQHIASVPQTPVDFADATAAYFEQARWAF